MFDDWADTSLYLLLLKSSVAKALTLKMSQNVSMDESNVIPKQVFFVIFCLIEISTLLFNSKMVLCSIHGLFSSGQSKPAKTTIKKLL